MKKGSRKKPTLRATCWVSSLRQQRASGPQLGLHVHFRLSFVFLRLSLWKHTSCSVHSSPLPHPHTPPDMFSKSWSTHTHTHTHTRTHTRARARTERERETETDRQKQRETGTERQRQRQRDRDSNKKEGKNTCVKFQSVIYIWPKKSYLYNHSSKHAGTCAHNVYRTARKSLRFKPNKGYEEKLHAKPSTVASQMRWCRSPTNARNAASFFCLFWSRQSI